MSYLHSYTQGLVQQVKCHISESCTAEVLAQYNAVRTLAGLSELCNEGIKKFIQQDLSDEVALLIVAFAGTLEEDPRTMEGVVPCHSPKDQIQAKHCTYVVACYSRGIIFQETDTLKRANETLNHCNPLKRDGYCIYSRYEWQKGFCEYTAICQVCGGRRIEEGSSDDCSGCDGLGRVKA